MTGDFYFSTLATFSIDPTNHLFVYRRLLLNVKRPAFETYPFLLSSSEFKMRGAVPPQTQIPPCRIKESPPKILISNPYYVHTEFQFSASSVSENKRVRSINPLNTELNPICHLLVLLGELTFLGTCIVSIFQYISNKMQRYTFYLYLETTLHISGGTSTHHQERIQLYLQHLLFVTPLLLSAAIVEVLEPV